MLGVLGFILLAFAPGALWLLYFYRKDRYDPEPLPLVLGTFLAGAVAVAPAIALEAPLEILWRHLITDNQLFYGVNFLFNVALVEEGLKFGLVYGFLYPLRDFDEPVDGLIYASAVALGFASAENLLYMFQMGWDIILLRGFLTTLAHVLFACMWGMALGKARFLPHGHRAVILRGLLLAVVAHALYDWLLMLNFQGGLLALVMLLAWMWQSTHRWIAWALSQSAHTAAHTADLAPGGLGRMPKK
ncbi:MAG TPA: PrsW family glutamic-type intramembrane protease [Candidatus Obscuribacterales bacterium]